ncbi:MAG: FAD:protein FMN transferase [bacterium]|nr:FAD:protein FMN transferase [bacterium]
MTQKKLIHHGNRILSLLCITILLVGTLSGCSSSKKEEAWNGSYITDSQFLLNTIVQITLYDLQDEKILQGAFDVCASYEDVYSRTLESSELYKLNNRTLEAKDGKYTVSDNLAELISKALYYSQLSNGAFDLTIAPVSSLWDFTSSNPTLPDDAKIKENLKHIDYNKVHVDGNTIWFDDDKTTIDLGAIAKGYIADRIKDYLKENGVNSAMINLGGNVLCVGKKPDGSPFNVGIQKPFADRNETCAIMELDDVSVVSSGIYERCITVDGKSYHHILNPKTGYSYENDLVAVTIVSKESVVGDGLSTSVFALGLEKGLELIDSLDNVYAVFITNDYELHYSEGFKEAIKVK